MDISGKIAESLARRSSRRFTDLPKPYTPRQHSGDQPCTCPTEAPIPSLTVNG